MARMDSVLDYITALFVIALAPAIFEEILFRSTIQPLFIGWTKNVWVGIIITSIFFGKIILIWQSQHLVINFCKIFFKRIYRFYSVIQICFIKAFLYIRNP